MKICTPVYYFILLAVIVEIWFYSYFSKYYMKNSYEFLRDISFDIIITLAFVWGLQCMCYGKCTNTVWIIFVIVLLMDIFSIYFAHVFNMKSPYEEINM